MNTVLYSGTGSEHTISGVSFQPDMTWLKSRTNSQPHMLSDAVRGGSKQIYPNTDSAETSYSQYLKSFNSDGFVLGTDAGINASGQTYASWNWKANGQGSANTAGSINTTYTSVNTTSGCSISQYTGNSTNGATVGHGLGAVPEMLIGKDLSDTSGWGVWHKDLTNAGYRLNLSTTDAQADDTALFGGSSRTAPTSSVFTLGGGGGLNGPNANIMYAFAPIKGYSRFNKFIGNGATLGPFVYCGFKPSFIIIKDITSTRSWIMVDNKRNTYNVVNNRLFPDAADAQNTAVDALDFLSNGFKIRSTNSSVNVSGNTYIYMAFASNPFVATSGSDAVPVTAE